MKKQLLLSSLLILPSCVWAAAGSTTTPAFLARRDYPVGGTRVTVADADGNDIPDVLCLSGSAIVALLGKGNGTFGQPIESQIGMYGTVDFAAADLNGDNSVDLVISGGLNGTGAPAGIGVSLGNGNGTFNPVVFYQAGTDTYTNSLVLGDFNNDGILDALVAGSSGLWLFTGKGGGAFNPPVLTPFTGAGARGAGELAAADFNKDGNLDLAVATPTGFSVLLGNGDGTFQAPLNFSTEPLGGLWIAAGSLDSSGNPGVALVPYNPPAGDGQNYILVYLGNGKGSFSGPTDVYLPGGTDIAIGDVNGDGILDLVNAGAYIALGKGNGTFTSPEYYPTSTFGDMAALADLRNNGLTDIVTQGSAVSVLLNQGKGKFQDGNWTSVPGGGACGAPADYNGDGKPDLAVPTSQGITILLGTGNESAPFTTGVTLPLTDAGCPLTGDFNGDGIPDLLVQTFNNNPVGDSGTMVCYLGNGDGTFTLASSTPISATGYDVVLGDFNNSGNLGWANSENLLALGNGDGTFQTPVPFATSLPPDRILNLAAGDLNNDGYTDLVYTSYDNNGLYILLNNQHGGFTQGVIKNTDGPDNVWLADLNSDGNLDAIVSMQFLGVMQVYLGNGKGGFTLVKQTIPNGYAAVTVADVNGDSIPDLLMLGGNSVAVFLGNGNGTFRNVESVGAGPLPGLFYTENLHGQSPTAGLPDIVLPDATGGVTVLFNVTK